MKFFNLKQFRKERNITQREFAIALGISQSVASYMENGTMEITDYQIDKVSQLYQVDNIEPYVYERDTYVSPEIKSARNAKDKPRLRTEDWNNPTPVRIFGNKVSICQHQHIHVTMDGTLILDPNNGLGFGLPPYIIEAKKLSCSELIKTLSNKEWFDDEMFEGFKRMYVIACALANVEPTIQLS